MQTAGLATYHCRRCGRTYRLAELVWRCACGWHLDLQSLGALRREQIVAVERSLWRYAAALPVARDALAAYFGEGLTPLVPARGAAWGPGRLHLKLDFLFPSGSFKDRGSAVLVNHLAALGVRAIHEDSSGNAGASLAAYAARAGLACDVYVPAAAAPGKLVQIAAYGARVIRVPGDRRAAAAAALAAEGTFYASHNWSPLFIEGVKTVAFEVWEQLGFRAPDNLVVPVGYGSSLLGAYRGFAELLAGGAIARLPRLFGVQSAASAPLVRAFAAGAETVAAVQPEPTIAEGVASAQPIRGAELLEALRASGGAAEAVTDDEVVAALRDLAAEGVYVEPTGAVAAAGYRRLRDRGLIRPDETTVVLLTGSGLKATERISALLPGS
jgi:threonine synthase